MSDTHSVGSSSSKSSKKAKRHSRNISVDKEKQSSLENDKLHKKFNIDPVEFVITTMKCSIKGRSGKLYITEAHVCFISKVMIKMSEKKKIVAFSDILEVEHDKNKQIVKLVKKNGKVVSLHFKESESAYLLIEGQWEASGNQSNSRLSLSLDTNVLSHSGNHFIPTVSGAPVVKHFNLPETETLVKDYRCALKGAFNHYGKLYLSQNYVCFYSAITSLHQKTRIKLRDVIKISMPEKSKNSIQIDTKTETYCFTKFNDKRESIYDVLNTQYELSKNSTPISTPKQSRSRSNSDDQSPKVPFRKMSTTSNKEVTSPNIPNPLETTSPVNSKPNSRRNSLQISPNPESISKSNTPSPSGGATPPITSTTTNAKPQTNTTTKIAQRLDNIESVSPAPAPSNQYRHTPAKITQRNRCCFNLF